MSEESGSGAVPSRVLLPPVQVEGAGADVLRNAWRSQEPYINHLEAQIKNFEGTLERTKEQNERLKQQYTESQHKERILVRRLAAKEQEVQDYAAQISELKTAQVGPIGLGASARTCLLDPAVNVLVMKMKQELTSTKSLLEETQNEFSAWKFTPDSNTGKKLMAKCRLLHQENEDLGKMTTSGRIAKLEGDLALQKSFSEEAKKIQSELDEYLQELDEEVEGMQSTILMLQQELRSTKEKVDVLTHEVQSLRAHNNTERPPITNGSNIVEEYESESELIIKVSEREKICEDEDSRDSALPNLDKQLSDKDRSYNLNGSDETKSCRTNCESNLDKKRSYESDWSESSSGGRIKKQRRASVLSLDYNEDDDLTASNGDVN